MLTAEDQRWLERSTGAAALRSQRWTVIAAIFLMVMALINTGLAFWIGNLGGYPPAQILDGWSSDLQLREVYPGAYVKALERLQLSLLQGGGALILGLRAAQAVVERARLQRLYAALQVADRLPRETPS